MKKNDQVLLYFVLPAAIAYVLINIYIDSGPVKTVCNAISAVIVVYGVLQHLIPSAPFVKKLNYRLKKIYVLRALITGEHVEGGVTEGEPFNKFKADLIAYTTDQISNRTALISSSEVFQFDFPVEHIFAPGTKPENKLTDWKSNLNSQFLLLTGEAGSGKTFELIKRINYLCGHLKPGLQTHNLLQNQKVPLYIELKSLDRDLDNDWIIDYILKSATIANFFLNQEQLKTLISRGDVIYFFDGLDEVQSQFRKDCVRCLERLAHVTGVHVTCRKEIFQELWDQGILPANNKPAEFFLQPISLEWINEIIREVPGKSKAEKTEMIDFISSKPGLVTHMSRPIILNLFIVVFQNLTLKQKEVLGSSDEAKTLDVLWENYEDVIYRKKLPKDSDMLGIRTITVWLAKIMSGASFYVESIQPNWLYKVDQFGISPHKVLQKLYFVVTRILASIIIGIAFASIISTPLALFSNSILAGIIISLLAGMYARMTDSRILPAWLSVFLFSLSMIICLTVGCGAYQGFSVPRAHEDMVNPIFSVTETWPGILLGMILSIIFSYRIILEKRKNQYVLPVELFHFDWPHAIRYGLSWGVASGIIIGMVAWFVRHQYANSIFIGTWLVPRLESILRDFHLPGSARNVDIALFVYAFLVTFFVASLLIILLAGRYNDPVETDYKNKQKLNYGIRRSGKHAILHALKVATFGAALYFATMMGFGRGSLLHCIKISFGIGVLAFLWFGGMEVINHVILRINLYMRGIAPLNYDTWVQGQQDMGLIIPTGYQMKFYHPSLAGYYTRYPIKDNPRIRLIERKSADILFYSFVLAVSLFFFAFPFLVRYHFNWYWQSASEITSNFQNIKKVDDSLYVVEKTGVYAVETSGYIHVGTFTGYSTPRGTGYGFMGMPMEGAYNLRGLESFRHAALLLRSKKAALPWTAYRYVYDIRKLWAEKGQLLQFVVNDKEWQNNSGHYKVQLTFCDTCKPEIPRSL